MARIKLAYIGGGSTRAAGTMASLIEQGHNFDGSEVVLIDLDADHLMAEIGQAGSRNQADIAGPNHGDAHRKLLE